MDHFSRSFTWRFESTLKFHKGDAYRYRYLVTISKNQTHQLRSAGCCASLAVIVIVFLARRIFLEFRSEFRDSPYVIIYKAHSNVSIAVFDQIHRASQHQQISRKWSYEFQKSYENNDRFAILNLALTPFLVSTKFEDALLIHSSYSVRLRMSRYMSKRLNFLLVSGRLKRSPEITSSDCSKRYSQRKV